MRLSHFFIERPVFATVLSLILTIAGAIAQQSLPISEYPEIVPPTVAIKATYPGASAEVIAQTVAAPIEQEVNGVDDMLYISSQSTGDGQLSINVVFKPGVNIDQAQVLVQNRLAVVQPRLPDEVTRFGITVARPHDGRAHDIAGWLAGSAIYRKLCITLHQGRAPSHRGRRRRFGLWRSRLFNEGLA